MTIHIMPHHPHPNEVEFLQAMVGPVVLLTRPSDVQPVRSALGRDLNALDICHYMLLWDSSIVSTFPQRSHFQ